MLAEIDIEVLQVTKTFGKTKVIDDVSLQVMRGEFLTLLGPSGCGKTTLLRMIAGFESPTSGKILLGGEDVTPLPPYKRNVHTVFQQYALFPHLTVFGNVAFGLERRNLAKDAIKKRVAEALDLVYLYGYENRYPNQLSGGEQQRVALARALVLEPKALLLDEPLSALDLKLRLEMRIELKRLQRQLGISFIFVTHDQEEALAMSDRIAVMNRGRIEQLGVGQEVYERPRTEFVADFIGLSNILLCEVMRAEIGWARIRLCEGDGDMVITTSELSPEAAQKMKPAEKIKIAVRPEKIRISSLKDGAIVEGTIEERIYLGDSTHWVVKLRGGSTVTVLEQNLSSTGDIARYSLGQPVYLSWDEHNSIVFEGTDNGHAS